jgi:hypothetical protein
VNIMLKSFQALLSITRVLCTVLLGLCLATLNSTSASAVTFSLSWESPIPSLNGSTTSLKGYFAGTDGPDENSLINAYEISEFVVTFHNSLAGDLVTYEYTPDGSDPFSSALNFNYDPKLQQVLQSGDSDEENGFFIGLDNEFILRTVNGVVHFRDHQYSGMNNNSVNGGVLIAEVGLPDNDQPEPHPIPEPSLVIGFLIATMVGIVLTKKLVQVENRLRS